MTNSTIDKAVLALAFTAFSNRAARTRSTVSAYDQVVIDPSLLRDIALDDGIAIVLRELLRRGNVHADFVAETLRGAFVKRKA